MEWGPKEEFLVKQAAQGVDVPALRKKPKLTYIQSLYLFAFNQISGSRQYTFSGSAEIPYSEQILWLNENDVTDKDDRDTYLKMIQALDSAYIEFQHKKNKVT